MASTPGGSSLLSASVASASSLIALQLLSRLTTFALNQALFRLASPTAFGAASIQLDLVLSTILFLSREGVRGALLRATGVGVGINIGTVGIGLGTDGPAAHTRSRTAHAARTGNLAFLPVLAGIPLALGTAAIFARAAGAELQAQPHFTTAVALYALAAVAELFSEPLYNVAMTELKVGVRVRAEGLGVTAKSLTTFLVLLYDARAGTGRLALVAFALGQLVYSAVVFGTYIVCLGAGYMRPKLSSPPSSLSSSSEKSRDATLTSYFDPVSLQLSLTLTLQSLVKHFLTEGDKLILSWFSPLRDQGGYAIAVNYGSLVARIVFQPIEETLRVFFSRTLGASAIKSTSTSTISPKLKPKSESIPTDIPAQDPTAFILASTTLISILATQTSLSLILIVFGTAYLPLLLPLLLPPAYLATSAPSVLAAWVWYIPVLAVNGALEAFLASVATPHDLNRQSRWMIGFSAIYITAALLLYRAGLGDASLVYANIVNLSARIVYCLRFIKHFFSIPLPTPSPSTPLFSLRSVLPSASLCLAGVVSAVLLSVSQRRLGALDIAAQRGRGALLHPTILVHVGAGAVLALGCLAVWWRTSGKYLTAIPLRRTKVE